MSEIKFTKISASKIKTFLDCSYFFYLNYLLKVPQSTSDALFLGSLTHTFLECLLYEKHRHYIPKINKTRDIFKLPTFKRLAQKTLTKYKAFSDENLALVNSHVQTALDCDFLCKGAEQVHGEYEFSIPFHNLLINGFIDKIAVYKNKVVIYDYKTNKKKFTGEDKEANLQAYIYLWVARQLFPGKKEYVLKFLFLRFPKEPEQIHAYDDTQIEGFKYYVLEVGNQIAQFTEQQAENNLAAHSTKKWKCRAGKTWECPYLRPFTYFALIDTKTKAIIKTARNKSELPKQKGCKVESKEFLGCIHFRREFSPQRVNIKDWSMF